jgi:hypothetical protein
MRDQPGVPAQPYKTTPTTEQTASRGFSSLFGFAKKTLNKTLNMG